MEAAVERKIMNDNIIKLSLQCYHIFWIFLWLYMLTWLFSFPEGFETRGAADSSARRVGNVLRSCFLFVSAGCLVLTSKLLAAAASFLFSTSPLPVTAEAEQSNKQTHDVFHQRWRWHGEAAGHTGSKKKVMMSFTPLNVFGGISHKNMTTKI